MSIRVFVELRVNEKRLEDARPLFSNLLHDTRCRKGNEGVIVYSNQDAPTTIALVE